MYGIGAYQVKSIGRRLNKRADFVREKMVGGMKWFLNLKMSSKSIDSVCEPYVARLEEVKEQLLTS